MCAWSGIRRCVGELSYKRVANTHKRINYCGRLLNNFGLAGIREFQTLLLAYGLQQSVGQFLGPKDPIPHVCAIEDGTSNIINNITNIAFIMESLLYHNQLRRRYCSLLVSQ